MCHRGVSAIIFALVLLPILLIAALAVDYSRVAQAKAALQEHLDSAVLAAASAHSDDHELTNAERIAIGLQHFKGATPADLQAMVNSIDISVTDSAPGGGGGGNGGNGEGGKIVHGTIEATVPLVFGGLLGFPDSHLSLVSDANTNEPNRQLDMVFCIDATGSMQPTINAVTTNAEALAQRINDGLAARGFSQFGGIRARAIFFRDFSYDRGVQYIERDPGSPGSAGPILYLVDPKSGAVSQHQYNPDNQSPMQPFVVSNGGNFYELPRDTGQLTGFLGAEQAGGGGDEPETSLVCVNDAIRSKWAKVGDHLAGSPDPNQKITTIIPMIVVWTDANAVPPDDSYADPYEPPPNIYPRSYAGLQANWKNPDLINQTNKLLVLFGDPNRATELSLPNRIPGTPAQAGWQPVAAWDKFVVGGSLLEGNSDLANKLVDVLAKSRTMPRLTQ